MLGRVVMLSAAAAVAAAQGCASYTALSAEDRRDAQRTLAVESDRYLRLSYYVTPFYGDASKRLLSPHPPDELRQVLQPNGEPVSPGPILKVLPAGTPAKILELEFPTAWAIASRVAYTPRFQPWVLLGVKGEPPDTPLVLLLRPNLTSPQELQAEVDRYLSKTDVRPLLDGLPEGMKTAIKTKTAVLDMPAEALEMAWGYPELKQVSFDAEGNRRETWLYPGGARSAVLVEGRVISRQPER